MLFTGLINHGEGIYLSDARIQKTNRPTTVVGESPLFGYPRKKTKKREGFTGLRKNSIRPDIK